MNIIVLFSGTKSIEKVYDEEKNDIRSVDLDNTFNPYYNVDILVWDYKKIFEKWVPDYIHGSPVCKEFSNMKHGHKRDMGLGLSLLNKTLEIIEYVKTLNPKLKYTIENPKGLMRKLDCMKPYNMITTSYCKYGFLYQKHTDFFYGGFELELRPICRNTKCDSNWCEGKKKWGTHRVRLGVSRNSKTHKLSHINQIPDSEYFKQYKIDNPEYKKYTNTYFRYMIPEDLCKEIKNCVEKENLPKEIIEEI
mgnify:CR=1 FL=1